MMLNSCPINRGRYSLGFFFLGNLHSWFDLDPCHRRRYPISCILRCLYDEGGLFGSDAIGGADFREGVPGQDVGDIECSW